MLIDCQELEELCSENKNSIVDAITKAYCLGYRNGYNLAVTEVLNKAFEKVEQKIFKDVKEEHNDKDGNSK